MALLDYFKGAQHKARSVQLEAELSAMKERCSQLQAVAKQYGAMKERCSQLQALAEQYGAMEVVEVKRKIAAEMRRLQETRQDVVQAEHQAATLATQLEQLRKQVLVVEETLLLESFSLYLPKFKLTSTAAYKIRLDEIRELQKSMLKDGTAATGNMEWEVNGKKSEGKKLVSDMIKLVIRSFNNECESCVDNVKFDNVELGERRIRQSFEACNKLGRVMTVEVADRYLMLKLDELCLAHEFQTKREKEKEENKRAREELREQQKLEQEIRAVREKIAKERKHFTAALEDLRARLDSADSEEDRIALSDKIADVAAGKTALDTEEAVVDYRQQNAKAGYVYVISNVGAFGDGVFKIGMTRRLDPKERVEELGDASVPFLFDVHAMVFTENAPALEAKLHEHFDAGRINKVNERKEFFRASIEEIETVIRECFDPVVEVVREAAAEQYRESLRMALRVAPVAAE